MGSKEDLQQKVVTGLCVAAYSSAESNLLNNAPVKQKGRRKTSVRGGGGIPASEASINPQKFPLNSGNRPGKFPQTERGEMGVRYSRREDEIPRKKKVMVSVRR